MENSTNIVDERDEYLAKWEIRVLSVILIFTIIGNCLVLFALYLRRYRGHRRKLTRMYFFVMHLSIADLITGLFNVLPQLAWEITFRFQGGAILCKVIKFIQPLGNYLSSYILIATAVDRFHAICYPLSYCRTTSMRSKLMVYGAWCSAIVACIPQIFVFSYQEISSNTWECWAYFAIPYGERIYVTWFSISVFVLPLVALIYTYSGICIEIWKNSEIIQFGYRDAYSNGTKRIRSSHENRQPLISRARINTAKQMITVVTLYAVTSSPFIGCQLWSTWDPYASKSNFFNGPTFTILTLLSSLTSCVNPWIYLGFNRELRTVLNTIIIRENNSYYDDSNDVIITSSIISTMFRFVESILYRNEIMHNRSLDLTTFPVPV